MRDRSIDLGKGIAILCVYLAHSMIYYPCGRLYVK